MCVVCSSDAFGAEALVHADLFPFVWGHLLPPGVVALVPFEFVERQRVCITCPREYVPIICHHEY